MFGLHWCGNTSTCVDGYIENPNGTSMRKFVIDVDNVIKQISLNAQTCDTCSIGIIAWLLTMYHDVLLRRSNLNFVDNHLNLAWTMTIACKLVLLELWKVTPPSTPFILKSPSYISTNLKTLGKLYNSFICLFIEEIACGGRGGESGKWR